MIEGLIDKNKKNVASDAPKIQHLMPHILDNVRFAECYVNPHATVEDILLEVVNIMYDEVR